MKLKLAGVVVAIVMGVGLVVVGQPTLDDKMAKLDVSKIESREVIIDPAELLDMMNDNNIKLKIIDVRDEADFNLFNLIDSKNATKEQLRDPNWIKELPTETVMVLISNDEKQAVLAWKILTAQNAQNLYVLKGGINMWLDIYGENNIKPETSGSGEDTLRHAFIYALGAKQKASNPDPHHAPKREYIKKVKPIGPAGRKAGGCG
jgi:rhodanese-related sulfurtransferase